MQEISKEEAFFGMDELDRKVMEQELHHLVHSDYRNGRKVKQKFFLDWDHSIVLKVFWDEDPVHTVRFTNKANQPVEWTYGELDFDGAYKIVENRLKDLYEAMDEYNELEVERYHPKIVRLQQVLLYLELLGRGQKYR